MILRPRKYFHFTRFIKIPSRVNADGEKRKKTEMVLGRSKGIEMISMARHCPRLKWPALSTGNFPPADAATDRWEGYRANCNLRCSFNPSCLLVVVLVVVPASTIRQVHTRERVESRNTRENVRVGRAQNRSSVFQAVEVHDHSHETKIRASRTTRI